MGYGPSARISGAAGWRSVLLLALLLATALLAGCSQEQSSSGEEGQQQGAGVEEAASSSPVEVVQVAYSKTAEAQTAKMDMTIDMNMGGAQQGGAPEGQPKGQPKGGISMQMGGQGAFDFENQRGNFVVQMPMGMGEIEMRHIGNVAYMRMPEQMQAEAPEGRSWVRMDLDEMAREQYGTGFADLQGGVQNDPTRQLEFLRSVSDSVEEVGEEEVRGEPTTHYTAVIDLEKAAEAQHLPEEAREVQERQAQKMIEQLGTSEMPVDVWIDDEGRLRRFEMSMALPAPAAPPQAAQSKAKGPQFKAPDQDVEGEIEMAYELYDFGTPVEVEEPPPDQVTDMQEFMAAAQQKGKGKEKAKGKGKQKEEVVQQ